jgi:hypothetical protein
MTHPTPNFTPAQLWQYIDYCTDTGALRLKPGTHHPDIKQFFGDCIWIKGRNYTFPRLTYYMHHGVMPKQLTRIDSPFDIRIENLAPRENTPTPRAKPKFISADMHRALPHKNK